MSGWVELNSVTALLMPGTHAQNVMWVALDEQLPPASTGVPLGLALALALALELALVDGAALLLDELDPPPPLQAASSVSVAAPESTVRVRRLILILSDLAFDNISGDSFVHLLSFVSATDRRLDEGEGLRRQGQDDGAALGCLGSVCQVSGLNIRQDARFARPAGGDGPDFGRPRERVVTEHDL